MGDWGNLGQLHFSLCPVYPQRPAGGSVLQGRGPLLGAGVPPVALPQPSGGPLHLYIHDQGFKRGTASSTLLSDTKKEREHDAHSRNCG